LLGVRSYWSNWCQLQN